MLTSMYNAFSVADYLSDQKWMGGKLDAIQLHGGTANWWDWEASVKWQADMFAKQDIDIMWSIPLIPYGATLGEAGRGKYDANFLAMAKQLAAASANDDKIYVRLGWEFNGKNWNSSSAVGQAEDYVAAFRKFVDIARTVSDKFVFEWCPAIDSKDMNPETAYPGDEYVDVIGIDMYYYKEWHNPDAAKAFDWFVRQPYGLQWQQDFAATHGKQTAIGEWGLNMDSPEFVKLALDWMMDHDMVYQNYWDSNAAFEGELSGGQYPEAAKAYLATVNSVVSADAARTITSSVDKVMGASDVALTLTGGAVTAIGNALDNIITGNAQDNTLRGGAGNDKMYGGAGNDRLDGGIGADTLIGGTGNDTYDVENVGDRIVERPGEGIDTVYAAVDYTLSANVENLYLVRNARVGTGNAGDNGLFGSGGDDVLKGLDGNDVLKGWAGNDTLLGGAGADKLYGAEGNDYLDGGTGADYMQGDSGNDTYIVDHAGDVVVEYLLEGQGGTDSVYASINYTLTDYVENLYLTGDARIGTGNWLNNNIGGTSGADTLYGLNGDDTLRGNAGNDVLWGGWGNDALYGGEGNDTLWGERGTDYLDGGTGADVMYGGLGDDTYVIDNAGDSAIEAADAGWDTVYASIDYTLSSNIETLFLTGNARVGTGNALNNVLNGTAGNDTLYGMAGDDTLKGGAGNDRLFGGAGADRFLFDRGSGKDVIGDFGAGDKIDLTSFAFKHAPGVTNTASGALIDLGGGDTILISGVTADHLAFTGGSFGFI